MKKSDFIRRIIISSILTAIAIALILTFCIFLFIQYTKPNENNTSISSGSVADVYHGGKKKGIIVEMSNGDQFQLVYPNFSDELYSEIGYDLDELCELLKGKKIEYRRMNMLPWIVEIHVDDTAIDNNVLTAKQITVSRIAIVIIGIITLAFPICGDVAYIKKQVQAIQKSRKKENKKIKARLAENLMKYI